ncbi:helix-turn-helix DNA binding domain protein [Arthrobacter phage Vibaki]|uniref:Helix-turn-helix DNA binding domain protein n=1 Tax=Arthrobacter phage Vibaki TaxID=2593333 RepID=A0A514TYV6_9CAUD|nr:helix-turn-helix DNA binding domain protein [Arthrobacter phage Vibaki]QDK01882.1 helix-turn-helix DNA binding domain protein [Arthrobacter phage Vibaki]
MPRPPKGTPTDQKVVTPKTMQRDDRLEKALEMRRYGYTYLQIAEEPWPDGPGGMLYGGDRHNARRAIVAARNDTIKEAADEVRQFEIERLDMILMGLAAEGLFEGVPEIVRVGLGVIATRAKLLGLNAPTEINQRGGGNVQLVVDGAAVRVGMDAATMEVTETDD